MTRSVGLLKIYKKSYYIISNALGNQLITENIFTTLLKIQQIYQYQIYTLKAISNTYNQKIQSISQKNLKKNKRKTNLNRTLDKDRRNYQGHCHDNTYKQVI